MSDCQRCGKCCTGSLVSTLFATSYDIKRWKKEDRQDILKYVDDYDLDTNADKWSCIIWISPRTDRSLTRCPFLRKVRNKDIYKCLIYETRPQACREYPLEGHDFTCRGGHVFSPDHSTKPCVSPSETIKL